MSPDPGPSRSRNAAQRALIALMAGAIVASVASLVLSPVGTSGRVDLANGDALAAGYGWPPASLDPASPGTSPAPTSGTDPTSTEPASPDPTTSTPAPTTTRPPTSSRPTIPQPPPPPPTTTRPAETDQDKVLRLVNAERAKAGCGQVAVDDRLTAAAQGHSTDMATRDYFSHTSPEGTSFADRARAAGYPRPSGENIARGYRSAEAVMQGWMNSSGHRNNILNCGHAVMGIGLDTNGWYWTQVFGR